MGVYIAEVVVIMYRNSACGFIGSKYKIIIPQIVNDSNHALSSVGGRVGNAV